MKRGEEENYTLPVLNIPYLSSSRNIKFPREISSYFTANSPYFAAKKKSISRVFFLLFGEISRGFRREKMHFIIAENKKWVIEFKSTVNICLLIQTNYPHILLIFEPQHKETNNLHVQKQSRRVCSNCTADQRLCFRYTANTILLLKYEIFKFLAFL